MSELVITIKDVKPTSRRMRPCSESGHIFWFLAATEPGEWPCLRGCGVLKSQIVTSQG